MTEEKPASPAHGCGAEEGSAGRNRRRSDVTKLALGALGVVYGDIGTSPLYALKECVALPHGVEPSVQNIFGLLSLFFWTITLVVSVKYILYIMRADNNGEGGVLALMALAARIGQLPSRVQAKAQKGAPASWQEVKRAKAVLITIGLFGAALLYGDGIITPAISVLSAVEGLEVATHAFKPAVVPVTCAILLVLFAAQRRGTARIGSVFGPMTLCWFSAIAVLGLRWVARRPDILLAANPVHAVRFFAAHGWHGFRVLGSVVLCITGGEALYADMGHFGTRAIRTAWYACVFPALLLCYFGQGALLLASPAAVANPFYALVPSGWLYPMVVLATLSTVVASQALISGAFSLTRQAVQLGYLPRMTVVHTSGKTEGQIFIPEVNRLLATACIALVISFKASGNLADAYGVAVTGTMTITSFLSYWVARDCWGWSRLRAGAVLLFLLAIDLSFLASCMAKVLGGGWFPLAIAAGVFSVMVTWNRGRTLLAEKVAADALPLAVFLADVEAVKPHRVSGTAVFLSGTRRGTPRVLLHHFKHNKSLHEQVVILSITTDAVPEVPEQQKIHLKHFDHGFWAVTAHYGFMESPDVDDILRHCAEQGLVTARPDTSFYLGRESLVLRPGGSGMADWRKLIFAFLSRNARSATDFFSIPPNRVIEIGGQVEI